MEKRDVQQHFAAIAPNYDQMKALRHGLPLFVGVRYRFPGIGVLIPPGFFGKLSSMMSTTARG